MTDDKKIPNSRLSNLRSWADSKKPAYEKSDAVYIAASASVIGLGLIWTVASQYMKTDDTGSVGAVGSVGSLPVPAQYVIKKKIPKGYELESDDELD